MAAVAKTEAEVTEKLVKSDRCVQPHAVGNGRKSEKGPDCASHFKQHYADTPYLVFGRALAGGAAASCKAMIIFLAPK